MLENIYFWKNKNGGNSGKKMLLISFAILVLLGAGGAGAWYYFVTLPAQKAEEETKERQRQAAKKLQDDIASVKDFYAKSLEGASLEQAINVITEMRRSLNDFDILKINGESYNCDTKVCTFGYTYYPGALLTLPKKTFWGKAYSASVSDSNSKGKKKDKNKSDFVYKGIESKLNKNNLQALYKDKKDLSLYPCEDVVSYILTYNSYVKSLHSNDKGGAKNSGELVIKGVPKSPVNTLESQLTGKVKGYGLLAGKWEMELKGSGNQHVDNIYLALQLLFYKQAYRDAFLIKRIESTNNGIKVSGGLVCKV